MTRRTTQDAVGVDRTCHDALVTSAPGRAFGPIVRPWQRYLRPPDMTTVRPHAEPYRAGTGRLGVLLLHGFTGSPLSMRPWAEHLAADGFRVVLPRLPGHGTTWQELNTTTWSDWYGTAELEFTSLATECEQGVLRRACPWAHPWPCGWLNGTAIRWPE